MNLDLPSGQHGKSADYPGSASELWIRKVLIPVKMYAPGGMRLREKLCWVEIISTCRGGLDRLSRKTIFELGTSELAVQT